MKDLQIKPQELENMGLKPNAIYQIIYDFPSPSKYFSKEVNEFLKSLRNTLNYVLKWNLEAIQYLESCWIINEEQLKSANNLLSKIIDKYNEKALDYNLSELFGNRGIEKQIKIFPIFTTDEGFEHYEDRKIEFMLEFIMENIKAIDKGLKEKRINHDILWRSKKAYEIVNILKDSQKTHNRFNEVKDRLSNLYDKIHLFQSELEKKRNNKP